MPGAGRSRLGTTWSRLLFAQVTHAIGLNDVGDALRMNARALGTVRGATPPSRNNLSHANRVRDCGMAEAVYWKVMEHVMNQTPSFAKGKVRHGYLRRFRKVIHALDSTTIQLVANGMDWAKHRRRKAAAKCHLRVNLQTFLPQCAIIDTAKFHDNRKARELCAALQEGEIVVVDKAYLDFDPLFELTQRGLWWVCRAKDHMQYRGLHRLQRQRRALADVDGVAGASAAALPGVYPRLGAQFHAPVHGPPGRPLAPVVPGCPDRFLWDSQTPRPVLHHPGTGLFAGICMKPVGQPDVDKRNRSGPAERKS